MLSSRMDSYSIQKSTNKPSSKRKGISLSLSSKTRCSTPVKTQNMVPLHQITTSKQPYFIKKGKLQLNSTFVNTPLKIASTRTAPDAGWTIPRYNNNGDYVAGQTRYKIQEKSGLTEGTLQKLRDIDRSLRKIIDFTYTK